MINGGFFLETRRTGTLRRGAVSELFVTATTPSLKLYRQDGLRQSRHGPDVHWNDRRSDLDVQGDEHAAHWRTTQERFTIVYAPDMSSATVRSEHSKDGVTGSSGSREPTRDSHQLFRPARDASRRAISRRFCGVISCGTVCVDTFQPRSRSFIARVTSTASGPVIQPVTRRFRPCRDRGSRAARRGARRRRPRVRSRDP